MKLLFATIVVLLGSAAAQAASPWILALPPAKTAPAPATPSPDPARAITDSLDRQAPITEWQLGQRFDGAEACEDARLAHIKEFDNAVEALGDRHLADLDRYRLTALAREAFGRCVPAFAFSESRPR